MPRIHYPKGIRTSRALRADLSAGGRRIPRRGCPFFMKARGALTRRSGESVVSVFRVRHLRLSTHLKSPQRRIPSLEGLPRPRAPSGSASGVAFSNEVAWRGPSQGSVSAGRPFPSRFSPRSGTCRLRHESRFRLSSGPRPPRTDLCVLLGEPRGLQPTVLHPHRLRRLVWRPTPNYEPGATGNTQGLSRRRW